MSAVPGWVVLPARRTWVLVAVSSAWPGVSWAAGPLVEGVVPEGVLGGGVQDAGVVAAGVDGQVDEVVVVVDPGGGDLLGLLVLAGVGVCCFDFVPGLDLSDGFGFATVHEDFGVRAEAAAAGLLLDDSEIQCHLVCCCGEENHPHEISEHLGRMAVADVLERLFQAGERVGVSTDRVLRVRVGGGDGIAGRLGVAVDLLWVRQFENGVEGDESSNGGVVVACAEVGEAGGVALDAAHEAVAPGPGAYILCKSFTGPLGARPPSEVTNHHSRCSD